MRATCSITLKVSMHIYKILQQITVLKVNICDASEGRCGIENGMNFRPEQKTEFDEKR